MLAWESGADPERAKWEAEDGERKFYWECDGPPDREYYRPKWTDEERTAYQMYETVSEGTPVTPVFDTPEGLVDYLVAHGDFWGQQGGEGGWPREAAESFVRSGWAPSMIAIRKEDGSFETKTARDGI